MTRYDEMLEAVQKDLDQALAERDKIDRRIAALKQTVIAFSRLIDDSSAPQMDAYGGLGITDRCREVLRTASKDLTPVEVRDQLVLMGLNEENYGNLMASVHRILKRLLSNEEIAKVTRENGDTAFRWDHWKDRKRRRKSLLGGGQKKDPRLERQSPLPRDAEGDGPRKEENNE